VDVYRHSKTKVNWEAVSGESWVFLEALERQGAGEPSSCPGLRSSSVETETLPHTRCTSLLFYPTEVWSSNRMLSGSLYFSGQANKVYQSTEQLRTDLSRFCCCRAHIASI